VSGVPSPPPGDDRLPAEAYREMTVVLRAGLVLALALLTGALIAYLIVHPSATSQTVIATNPILTYLSFDGLVHGLATGRREAYLTLGLLVLLATPIARVVTGAYYFHRDGEREMTAITVTVFVLLLVGLFVIGPYIP
jgi:uncharacterized membrane protein